MYKGGSELADTQDILSGRWGFNLRSHQIQSILRTCVGSVVGAWVEKRANVLEDVSGEVYPLAPLNEYGEEGTTGCANEDDEDGTNP